MQRLIKDYLPRMRRFASLVTGDPKQGDACVENAVKDLLAGSQRLIPEAEVKIQFFSILRKTCNSTAHASGTALPSDLFTANATAGNKKTVSFVEVPPAENLGKAFRGLSREQKEVLILVIIEEFRYDETARVLDIPVDMVRLRLYRARTALNAALGGPEF